MAKFLELLEGQSQGHWTLGPEGTVQHFSTDSWKLLNPGDHVVVMIGGWRRGYAHHGIVIIPYGPGQDPQVAHFVSPTGDMLMRDARLQIGSHTEFIGARGTFGIVPYASANSESEKFERQRAVDLAKGMFESPEFARKKYNLIAWNCECFAWVCKTGDINAHSHQVERVLKAISDDLRKGERVAVETFECDSQRIDDFVKTMHLYIVVQLSFAQRVDHDRIFKFIGGGPATTTANEKMSSSSSVSSSSFHVEMLPFPLIRSIATLCGETAILCTNKAIRGGFAWPDRLELAIREAKTLDKNTLFRMQCDLGAVGTCERMLDNESDAFSRAAMLLAKPPNYSGETALIGGCKQGNVSLVEILIRNSPNEQVLATNNHGIIDELLDI
eukprot:gene27328-biopygen3170